MAYTLDISIALGAANTGLTLEAQLVDTAGVNVGSAVTSGFTEIGGGNYLWHYISFPDGHRGGAKFQDSPGGTLRAFVAINPEEAENLNGHIPQTGDNFARLGAPVGASVSADIAAVKADTGATVADTNELQADWADGGRLDAILDARASQSSVNTVDTNVSAIQTILTGITSLANWLRALVRSDAADATAKTEINSGAGGYDEATDSQQAIRDQGDVAWITGGDATAANQTSILGRLPAALVGGRIDASVGAVANDAITAAAIANDAITAAKIATGALDADAFAAGAITAAVIASGAFDADALATDAVTEIVDAIGARQVAVPSGAPVAPYTYDEILGWVFALHRLRRNQSADTETLFAEDALTPVATSAKSDDGTTFERGAWS